MSPRRRDQDLDIEIRPPTGGLQTKYGSPIVVPSQSPDLENVLFDRRSVRRRDGCVPVTRHAAPKLSIRNTGYTWLARDAPAAPPPNEDITYKRVDGYGFIGHRESFNAYNTGTAPNLTSALTVSLLTSPEPQGDGRIDNTTDQWWLYNQDLGTASKANCRPILSKGPHTEQGRANAYLTGEGEDLSFFFWVARATAFGQAGGDAPIWACTVKVETGGSPVAVTLYSSATNECRPQPGHVYRLTLFVASDTPNGGTFTFRIAKLRGDGTVATEDLNTAITGHIAQNSNPIWLFDIDKSSWEATMLQGASDHTRHVLRYEGRLEEISLWNDDRSIGRTDFSFSDSFDKLDITQNHTALQGHWGPYSLTELNPEVGTFAQDKLFIPESFGRDAPIVFGPSPPRWNKVGGRSGLYFGGYSSYAWMATATKNPAFDNINYRGRSMNVPISPFGRLIQGAAPTVAVDMEPHSIVITFVADTIGKDQYLLDWPGVVRLLIDTSGQVAMETGRAETIAAYTHNVRVVAAIGQPVIPGQRYTLVYRRQASNNGAGTATVHLNGVEKIPSTVGQTTVATAAGDIIAAAVGAHITDTTGTNPQGGGGIGETDRDDHFCGRIEDIRFAGGDVPVGAGINRDLRDEEIYIVRRIWDTDPMSATVALGASDQELRLPLQATLDNTFMHFHAWRLDLNDPPFYSFATSVALLITASTNPYDVTVFPNPRATAVAAQPVPAIEGTIHNNRLEAVISPYIAWWNFEDDVLENPSRESRYRRNRETSDADAQKLRFYDELYAVPDKLGFSLPLHLRCRQNVFPDPDIVIGGTNQNPGLWWQKTPEELRPRLAKGLVSSYQNSNPITLIRDFKRSNGDRFTIVAAASTIYWLQPPWWRGESPFSREQDPPQRSYFGSGGLVSGIEIYTAEDWDLTGANVVAVQMWIKVPDINSPRELALNWASADGVGEYNWRLLIGEGGNLQMEGVGTGGNWSVGTVAVSGGASDRYVPLDPDRWHHLLFVMDGTDNTMLSDQIYLDGVLQPMDNPLGAPRTPSFGAGGGTGKYVAGHRFDRGDPSTGSLLGYTEPFFGWMRDFQVLDSNPANGDPFTPPSTPLASPLPASVTTYIPLDDGEGVVVREVSGGNGGIIRQHELLPIADGKLFLSNSTEKNPFDAEIYNEVLYLTNGLGPPLAVRHYGQFLDSRGTDDRLTQSIASEARNLGPKRPYGFQVSRMGVEPPRRDTPTIANHEVPAGTNVFTAGDQHLFAITNVSVDGIESDPIVYPFTIPNAGNPIEAVRLTGLPRPLEEHVVERGLYVGGTGNQTPLLFSHQEKLAGKLSDDVEIDENIGVGRRVEFIFGAPPVADLIVEHRQRIYLAAGDILYFSEGGQPEHVALGVFEPNFIQLQSRGGHRITGLDVLLGQLYAGKRDALFEINPGTLVSNFQTRKINTSKGWTGGLAVVSFDNVLFGPMEKGVHAFGGGLQDYLGDELEALWALLDRGPDAMRQASAIYFEPLNQYWLTIKRLGERFGTEILVYDKVVVDPLTQRSPWTRIDTLPVARIAVVEDRDTDQPRLMIGTPEGAIFEMLRGQIDGSFQHANPSVGGTPFVLSGTATGGSATTLSIAGGFDTIGDGLKGLFCRVTDDTDGTTATVRIRSNTNTTLTFETALPFTVAALDTFLIGLYHAYWTSPWLPLTTFRTQKHNQWLDLDFRPNTAIDLDTRILGTDETGRTVDDAFDYDGVPVDNRHTVDMTLGWHNEPVYNEVRGRYLRLYFGTFGINLPFEVYGFALTFDEEGIRGGGMQ